MVQIRCPKQMDVGVFFTKRTITIHDQHVVFKGLTVHVEPEFVAQRSKLL